MQYVPGNRANPGEIMEYTNSDISRAIDEYIHHERNRAILKRRLIDGICYEPLAEEFGLVHGKTTEKVIAIMDELMDALRVLNLRLYNGVLRKLEE